MTTTMMMAPMPAPILLLNLPHCWSLNHPRPTWWKADVGGPQKALDPEAPLLHGERQRCVVEQYWQQVVLNSQGT